MSAHRGNHRGLPEAFGPAHRSSALYEDVRYEEYWEGAARVRQDALEKRLISQMLPAHGRRIIDLGCGFGRLLPCYIDRFDCAVLYDGSLSLLRQAREVVGNRATLVAGDVQLLPFKQAAFDAILSIRVLQHVHDLDSVLAGMRRLLSRNGQLFFSYHNKRNARRMLHFLVSRHIADPFSTESAEVSPALLSHHPDRMGTALASAGFSAPQYRGAAVVGSCARITEKLGRTTPSGLSWASFLGEHRLAPWLIGRASAQGGEDLLQADSVYDLLACPACRGNLQRSGDALLVCMSCHTEYPVREGILDLRLQGGAQ